MCAICNFSSLFFFFFRSICNIWMQLHACMAIYICTYAEWPAFPEPCDPCSAGGGRGVSRGSLRGHQLTCVPSMPSEWPSCPKMFIWLPGSVAKGTNPIASSMELPTTCCLVYFVVKHYLKFVSDILYTVYRITRQLMVASARFSFAGVRR